MKTILALALSLASGGLLSAQTTWVVDAAGGSGSQFTEIQPAVDVAVDGDRIVVRSGLYTGFSIDGEALAVLAEPGANLFGGPDVRNTSASQEVVLAGFTGFGGTLFLGANIANCAGRVLFEGMEGTSWQITDSADVRVSQCRMAGAVTVQRSRLTMTDSVVSGGPNNLNNEPALDVSDSRVTLARCSVSGQSQLLRLPGTPAVVVHAPSVLTLTGDGNRGVAAGFFGSTPLSAIVGDGTVIRDPRVRVTGNAGAPGVSVGVDRVEHVPALQALGAPVGSTVEVDLAGLPGESWFLVFGLPGTPLELPGIRGELGLSLPLVTEQGVFGAQSVHRSILVAPGLPLGFQLCWQALTTDGQGGFVLSNHATYARVR